MQLVDVSDLKSECCGFESHLPHQSYAWLRRKVIRLLYTESDVSSSLTPGTKNMPDDTCVYPQAGSNLCGKFGGQVI